MGFQPVYVVDGARTPFLKGRNAPGPFSASDLALQAGRGLLIRQPFAASDIDEVVLVGHSLGARVMLYAADALSLKSDAPRVRDVHLLGAAVSSKHDWSRLHSVVTNAAYVYHSRNDAVLSFVYTIVQGGSKAAGSVGAATKLRRIHNVDVTTHVAGHSAYCTSVDLRGAG